ncbi:MAG: hypothetical protein KDD62_01945 [Bdellovibrionales bacterium]|nr:hypothetical protein [Bdellovibrionales bacterium]
MTKKLSAESEMYFLKRILLSELETQWETRFSTLEDSYAQSIESINRELQTTIDMLSEQVFQNIEALEKRLNSLEMTHRTELSHLNSEIELTKDKLTTQSAQLREDMLHTKSMMNSKLIEHKKSLQEEVSKQSLQTQMVIERSSQEKAKSLGKPQMAELFSELAQKLVTEE